MHYLQKTGKRIFHVLQSYFLMIAIGIFYPCASIFAQSTPENTTSTIVNAMVYDDKGGAHYWCECR